MFDVEQFITDLRAALGERSRLALKEIVERALSDVNSLRQALGEPSEPGVQLIHRGSDLTVLNVTWAPNQITLPHDHRMTAVIGLYGGREDNLFWRRAATAHRFSIEAAGGLALGDGDVALLGPDVIHSVVNPLGRFSGAIHVYDGDFLGTPRSMWNPLTLAEEPYDVAAVLKGTMPVTTL
jgi:predicted metal-dependent enzyme (double-stranded beta helix superfamily)